MVLCVNDELSMKTNLGTLFDKNFPYGFQGWKQVYVDGNECMLMENQCDTLYEWRKLTVGTVWASVYMLSRKNQQKGKFQFSGKTEP